MSDEEVLDSATGWVAEHTQKYVESNGEDGHLWRGVHTLVITTRGRKSGKLRRNALIYGQDGDRYVVVASKGGAEKHPMWYLNLTADPNVQLQVGSEHFDATARTASPDEKERLWPMMAAIWPNYDQYQTKTSREIPVIILERA